MQAWPKSDPGLASSVAFPRSPIRRAAAANCGFRYIHDDQPDAGSLMRAWTLLQHRLRLVSLNIDQVALLGTGGYNSSRWLHRCWLTHYVAIGATGSARLCAVLECT
jgi:hypothetical protein